jgi:hypothetical protein
MPYAWTEHIQIYVVAKYEFDLVDVTGFDTMDDISGLVDVDILDKIEVDRVTSTRSNASPIVSKIPTSTTTKSSAIVSTPLTSNQQPSTSILSKISTSNGR